LFFKAWEKEINEKSQGKPKISVRNTVDLTGPPEDFTYTTSLLLSPEINVSQEPLRKKLQTLTDSFSFL